MAVSIDTNFDGRVAFFDTKGDFTNIVKPYRRLAVAAENELGLFRKIARKYVGEDLIDRGFALEPKAVRAVCAVTVIADAELAAVGATVGDVDIKAVIDLIGYSHCFSDQGQRTSLRYRV